MIELASDESGWPVIRFVSAGQRWPAEGFLSVFPLMKQQVDAFIYSGGAAQQLKKADPKAPDRLKDPVKNLESRVMNLDGGDYRFAEDLTVAHQRAPLEAGALLAMVATNFTVQPREQELDMNEVEEGAVSPHPDSEAAALLRWLDAGLLNTSGYDEARKHSKRITQRGLLEAVLSHGGELCLARPAALVVERLRDELKKDQARTGLPFLEQGCWELTRDTITVDRWAQRQRMLCLRPVVAGRHHLLQALTKGEEWRRVFLLPHHPAVGMRPVIRAASVKHHVPEPLNLI